MNKISVYNTLFSNVDAAVQLSPSYSLSPPFSLSLSLSLSLTHTHTHTHTHTLTRQTDCCLNLEVPTNENITTNINVGVNLQ